MNLFLQYTNLRTALARNKATKADADRKAAKVMVMLAMVTVTLMPEIAMAAVWDSTATQILGIFTGGLTRTIAIIAVIACGIGALAGKLSWEWAIKIIVGIVLIFGGATIVDYVISAASGS